MTCITSGMAARSFFPAFSIIFSIISSPTYAAEVGRITLPIMLSTDDARTQPQTTVGPMLKTPVDILGPRRVSFRSTANIAKNIQIGKKGKEILISSSDKLIEYSINIKGESFPAYCKSYTKRPLNGIVCLADRKNVGSFDQLWLGDVANPDIMIPFQTVRLQNIALEETYEVQKGPIPSKFQFGFSVTEAGGLGNKRELHLQITDGNQKVYMFYDRVDGPSRKGPVDIKIFDSQIRLYGYDSKTVTYSIEKPFTQQSYSLFKPDITQNVWIYVPG